MLERDFLKKGGDLKSRADRRARRMRKATVAVAIVMTMLAGAALVFASRASSEKKLAESQKKLADEARTDAVQAQQKLEIKSAALSRALAEAEDANAVVEEKNKQLESQREKLEVANKKEIAARREAKAETQKTASALKQAEEFAKQARVQTGRAVKAAQEERQLREIASEEMLGLLRARQDASVRFEAIVDQTSSTALSPDGRYLLSPTGPNAAELLNVQDGKKLAGITGKVSITSASFSADGKRVAVGGADGSVRVLDTLSGAEQFKFGGGPDTGEDDENKVTKTVLSPDGRWLAAALPGGLPSSGLSSAGGTVQIWDLSDNSPQPKSKVLYCKSPLTQIGFSKTSQNGLSLVTTEEAGAALLWDLRAATPVSTPLVSNERTCRPFALEVLAFADNEFKGEASVEKSCAEDGDASYKLVFNLFERQGKEFIQVGRAEYVGANAPEQQAIRRIATDGLKTEQAGVLRSQARIAIKKFNEQVGPETQESVRRAMQNAVLGRLEALPTPTPTPAPSPQLNIAKCAPGGGMVEFSVGVESLPDKGPDGLWKISGISVLFMPESEYEPSDRSTNAGQTATIKGVMGADCTVKANDIEYDESRDHMGEIELTGVIAAPFPAGSDLTGRWIVNGMTVHVGMETEIEADARQYDVGTQVKIEGKLTPEGEIKAEKIKQK